jgi:indole-3-glycerol phosphate synthase
MNNILEKIKDYKLIEAKQAENAVPVSVLESHIAEYTPPVRDFLLSLRNSYVHHPYGIIAEIKKASPSKGIIRQDFNPVQLAQDYQSGGAVCLSVLTDKPSFMGDDSYLMQAKNACSLPCLRKDFMFTPYQIIQSRALGADCILLIMACIDNIQAAELEQIAFEYNMNVLIEVHDESECERALTYLKSEMIGINNRNLKTFEIDLSTSEHISKMIPKDKLIVCESGIFTQSDMIRMKNAGMTHFLIGESLMRQDNVTDALQGLLCK